MMQLRGGLLLAAYFDFLVMSCGHEDKYDEEDYPEDATDDHRYTQDCLIHR